MSTKDSKTFEKLKKFFSFKNVSGTSKPREDFVLNTELVNELCSEAPIGQRVKTLKDLTDSVTSCPIDDAAAAKLWELLKDLLEDNVSKENRHIVFNFFRALIQDKHEKLGIMRAQFFKVVKNHNIPEDVGPRLELFQSLTSNGKFLQYFEEEVGTFLLDWMPAVIDAGREQDFLQILINVFKYNVSYIDETVVAGLVQSTCMVCCQSSEIQVVLTCLEVLHTVVCYPGLPPESLLPFIATLCRTVNLEVYCPTSWKIMKNLLGTHLGHSSLYTMCQLLKYESSLSDVGLLRGAVFYINMALWGGKNRVSALKCTPSSVLPSFQAALKCKHSLVMYEVMLSIQRLIHKHGHELLDPSWNIILNMICTIVQHLDESPPSPCLSLVSSHLHDTLNAIEHLIEVSQFNSSVNSFFDIIEHCSSARPEASVLRLMTHLSAGIDPCKDNWLEKLNMLMSRFFKKETRTNIRIKALSILSNLIKSNRTIYEEEIVKVVQTNLREVAYDPDVAVRSAAAQLLVDLCLASHPKHVLILMDIMEPMMNRVFKVREMVESEEGGADMKLCAHGLVQAFSLYLYSRDPEPAVRAYIIISNHLREHYNNPSLLANVTSIRFMMLECLLKLRADTHYRIGFKSDSRYSMYLVTTTASRSQLVTLPVNLAVEAVVQAIKHELDWKVLLPVLQELPHLLKNKALLISNNGSEVHQIANALCAMVSDKTVCSPERLKNTPPKFTRSELQNYVFPVLASLVSYHAHLEPTLQQRIVKCLECGLASKSASQCVLALTTCTLEMRDTMVKLLPEVLLNLSKISATVLIAIPILEFLSTLTQLPTVFANFVCDQYMSVFAISLPYTNPCRYTHYTVSLAHHVIAAWFLKCRLPFRRDFVKFIINSLKPNILPSFFEENQVSKIDIVNEDSSNRKRSSSLTEQGSTLNRRRERAPTRIDLKSAAHDENMLAFHRDLTETCIDLMAMYTYQTVSAVPKRHRTAEMLLNEGQSMTWLLGNKCITVTTSGCTLKAIKHGLCDRCYQICRIQPEPTGSPPPDLSDDKKIFTHSDSKSSQGSGNGPSEEQTGDIDTSKVDHTRIGYEKKERTLCGCWCQGWAEIIIRRPAGVLSWMMRIQNDNTGSLSDLTHSDVSSLFLPPPNNNIFKDIGSCENMKICSEPVSIPGSPIKRSNTYTEYDDIEFEVNGRSRNPVRRSNSSPEMSASWKSPLTVDQENNETKKKQNYNKDHRLNCEAIPEEMGTTPPTCEALMLAPMDHVDTKPPVPNSPRMYKGDDLSSRAGQGYKGHRERVHTISVMSPVRKNKDWDPKPKEQIRSGVNPAFVFLQLYHSTHFGASVERPILLPPNFQKSLKNLDWIPPYEVHKIGVLYVGAGQANSEHDILRNQYGSVRYAEFLQRLGTLVNLAEADRLRVFLGGLETNGNDGKFAYIWHDDVMQVVFHIATLMPNAPNDPHGNHKKTHIGNNYVTIVYNDSGEEYNFQTVKAQFNYAVVVIEPLDFGTNLVCIKAREELVQQICHTEYKIVSDQSVAILARQLAVHANLAALITSRNSREPYASNWLERLRWIKRIQSKLEQQQEGDRPRPAHPKRPTSIVDEFTDYTSYN